jgi:cytochrome c
MIKRLALTLLLLAAPSAAQDGKALFEKRCGGCHALDANREGPQLHGVVGRQAGAVKNFGYSKALQNAKFKWDQASLNKWLADPESVAPDNDMAFRVANEAERTAIIRFLATLPASAP